jgi:urease accessory protein
MSQNSNDPLIPAKAGTQAFLKPMRPAGRAWASAFAGMGGLGLAFPALAHPGHGPATLLTGLEHPFTGADHLLAMVSVGLWAALRGGRALWAWPAAFVTAMLAGFAAGQAGPHLPFVEPAILASVVILGALVAADARTPTLAGVALVGLFGLAHGIAHGAEAPANAGLGFPIGFAASTASLHLIGLGAGLGLATLKQPVAIRALGVGAAAGGLLLAFAS